MDEKQEIAVDQQQSPHQFSADYGTTQDRALQSYVKENPPDTDYALFADYAFAGGRVFYVHTIVCDRAGRWVLVELQNSHHPQFAELQPKTSQDANRLVIANLRQWLGK